MLNFKKIFIGSIFLVASITIYATCPTTDTIKCNVSGCQVGDANFDTLGYVGDPDGQFSVSFTQVFGFCQLQPGNGLCASPITWGGFRCIYQIGNRGSLTLEWRSENYVALSSPPWSFDVVGVSASCNAGVNECRW